MRTFLTIMFFFCLTAIYSQQPAKRALTLNDIPGWKTINGSQISDDGKLISYELNPLKGDGKLVYMTENQQDSIQRGYNAAISPESNYIVFKIKQPEAVVRKAKKDKISKDKMPKDSLGIVFMSNDSVYKFAGLISYKIPEEKAQWIAFLNEKGQAKKDTSKNAKEKKGVKQPGDNLVLFNTLTKDTMQFSNVTDYCFAKKGTGFCFVQERKDSLYTYSTLKYFNPSAAVVQSMFSEKGWIKKTSLSENGERFAFLFSADTAKEKEYALWTGKPDVQPGITVNSKTSGMPIGWSPSDNREIQFSRDGGKIYFGTAKTPKPEPVDSLLDDEKPALDIWNWKDLKLQPQQKTELEKEKTRTYLAVYLVESNRFVQLADLNVSEVSTIQKGNGEIALGADNTPYQRASSWTGKANSDYYLIDFKSGIKRRIARDVSFLQLSPAGKYVIWFNAADSCWYSKSTDINRTEPIRLTADIPVIFCDEEYDMPEEPRPYGLAGWAEDDKSVFIYDRYDIWKIDPTREKVPVCITKAFGRRNNTRLRYVKTDRELENIPSNTDILLSAFDERTASSGYFKIKINTVKDPEMLIMDNFSIDFDSKAKKSDKIIWTKQSVSVFPDIWLSDLDFKGPKRVTNANPGQKNYIWPTVETVEWQSFNGETLKGLLYKPDNLDPQKKYPIIVYYYERNFETKNKYQNPTPSSSTVNKTYYTSNGYLVFIPDITYKTGYPGQSAYNSIVSGTQYLTGKYAFIDKKHVGLQGQSWGGYQTAYLITQTDMYAAAMAGAPVANMTSAYGGIRWETGMSRMFQYEHSQSRIGGTLWEKPLQYIENSPLFYAPKVNTPLLIMHNDADGAVPWYQGIEFFVALRRLDKPVWMLSYNGEPHNLKPTSWANRMDLTERMFDFFEHYLKGKPMPAWMEKGVPAIEKGKPGK